MTKLSRKGFSLVEMIVYIAILTIVLLVMINTLFSFTRSYRELGALRVTESAAVTALERMIRDIRNATSIDAANSVFGSSPGSLTIVQTYNSVSTTTRFVIENSLLKVYVNGSYVGPLTSSSTAITNLIFTQLSGTTQSAVKIDMTISGTKGPYTKTKTYHSSVILKGS